MEIQLSKTTGSFSDRHNGPSESEFIEMLEFIGLSTIDELMDQTIPKSIRLKSTLQLPEAKTEEAFLREFKSLASKNKLFKNYIGQGYYPCHTPTVIQRNILENPGWYTAYTPYQAEIAQGRLEALINFQTMIIDLTGMEIANASLLDEATAAAEAMTMFYGRKPKSKNEANTFLVDSRAFRQNIDVLKTRAEAIGITLKIADISTADLSDPELYGIFIQYPDLFGTVHDYKELVNLAHQHELQIVFAADLMALALITSPGELGADAVIGSTQRFGVPLGYGGPHAAYFATRDNYKRQIPGRIIGASIDAHGEPAFRMALQTREQHIRREKATSNICTSQVLLAVMAGMYAVYHGPDGIKKIARRIHAMSCILDKQLQRIGYHQLNEVYFDTLCVEVDDPDALRASALEHNINLFYPGAGRVCIALDETTTQSDLVNLFRLFALHKKNAVVDLGWQSEDNHVSSCIPDEMLRTDNFLSHPVFNNYHSEHELLRYMKKLENKDLSLTHSMISLGSCTMKLNATSEMIPISWPELAQIHPFAPEEQTAGYSELIATLGKWLAEITGFDAVSFQPNSGAQGEFAGLMVIKAYLESRGQMQRKKALIPSSAHGTNPASAVMAGMEVVILNCDEYGNIDIEDLKTKVTEHADQLAVLMVTYPSTHGVFEEDIREICQMIHEAGGQVYMDGANMNAQVGLTSPGFIGADVCHLNLHKTFCIPHGGGGPGVGPIGVAKHLSPFLPGHVMRDNWSDQAISAVSAAPYGSAGILAISYAYIAMMGSNGLIKATKMAILNANYMKARLESYFNILYTGKNGRCAHEMIIDCRHFKKYGVEVADIAKRLMDYGFHAPTVSFPVPGTVMIEPTESESKEEMDRFCDAMIAIRSEIEEIENGMFTQDNNVLVNAPHSYKIAVSDDWPYPYSRSKAIFPLEFVKNHKFWPSVGRIDNAHGDRNLVCSCLPVEDYIQA